MLWRVLMLCGVATVVQVSAAKPPAMWFWGSGSDESISGIEQHRASLNGADVYYSISAGAVSPTGAYIASGNKTKIDMLKGHGYKVHAIMGCSNITALRLLFANPTPFITGAIANALDLGLDGINFDFEPYSSGGGRIGVTNQDGLDYATFVSAVATALQSHNIELSVDYFSNLAIWNLAALNSTGVNTLMSMDTYVQENSTMEAYTQVALGYIDPARLGVGICPQPSETRKPYGPDPCGPLVWTPQMVSERLAYIATLPRPRMLNFCCSGVLTDVWWAGLANFYRGNW